MNELKVFENEEFGKVRMAEIDGKPYFCGSDVASALGYKRPNDAVSAHCRATAKNWYRKNLWKIKPCAVKMYCSVEEFLDFLFEYLNNFFDTLTAKEIYEEQTGNKLEKDVDLLDFFPDMGERAQEILNFTYSYKMDK